MLSFLIPCRPDLYLNRDTKARIDRIWRTWAAMRHCLNHRVAVVRSLEDPGTWAASIRSASRSASTSRMTRGMKRLRELVQTQQASIRNGEPHHSGRLSYPERLLAEPERMS